MPRRRPDKVIEHRISLSDFERAKINRVEKIAAANVGLDAITGVAMAAGTALAGGGALLAAVVLMKWKAPDIIADVTNATNSTLDTVADVLLPANPSNYEEKRNDSPKKEGRLPNSKRPIAHCQAKNTARPNVLKFNLERISISRNLKRLEYCLMIPLCSNHGLPLVVKVM